MWDFDKIKQILELNEPKFKYLITDDKNEFLDKMEEIAKRGLKNNADNLKCLELLSAVESVRNGADILEVFPILK